MRPELWRAARPGPALAGIALFAALASDAHALAMSHGVQLLPIGLEECTRRAAAALQQEGYGQPAPAVLVAGFKGVHGAYVYCGARPDGTTTVNVFVASENVVDGDVPGGERVRLQQRMEGVAAAPQPPASAHTPAVSFAGRWETNYGPLTFALRGNQLTGSYRQPPGRIEGRVTGLVFGGRWIQGERSGLLRLELAPDGASFTGSWTEPDGRSGGRWEGRRIP